MRKKKPVENKDFEFAKPMGVAAKEARDKALDTQIDVKKNENKCVVYAAVFGEELQQGIVFSQRERYNS